MKKWLMLFVVIGAILYLKPGLKFPDGTDSLRIKGGLGDTVFSSFSVGQTGRIVKVTGEDGKRYYIPVDNILLIKED